MKIFTSYDVREFREICDAATSKLESAAALCPGSRRSANIIAAVRAVRNASSGAEVMHGFRGLYTGEADRCAYSHEAELAKWLGPFADKGWWEDQADQCFEEIKKVKTYVENFAVKKSYLWDLFHGGIAAAFDDNYKILSFEANEWSTTGRVPPYWVEPGHGVQIS